MSYIYLVLLPPSLTVKSYSRQCDALRLGEFPTAEKLQWHGSVPNLPDWSDSSRFVAFSLVKSAYCSSLVSE